MQQVCAAAGTFHSLFCVSQCSEHGDGPCRNLVDDVQMDSSGAVTSVFDKMHVLLRVSETKTAACKSHIAELAAAAVAACCGLCAFTSPRRPEVLAAVRELCGRTDSLSKLSGRPAACQRAEQMLPGVCATLMLTIAEAHLAHLEVRSRQPAAGAQLPLEADCIVLRDSGPQLRSLPDRVSQVVFLMLPAAVPYTAALANSRPHALTKKCLLAAILKMTANITVAEHFEMSQAEHAKWAPPKPHSDACSDPFCN